MLKSCSYVCKSSQVQVVEIQGANNQNRLVFKDGEHFGSHDLEKNLAIPAFFKQAYIFGHGMPIGIVCLQPYNVCRVKSTKVMEDCGKLYLPSGQQFDEHKTQVYMTNEVSVESSLVVHCFCIFIESIIFLKWRLLVHID